MPVSPGLNFATLAGEDVEAVFDMRDSAPRLLHLGTPVDGNPSDLAAALDWPTPDAGIDALAPLTLLPEASLGFPGPPGIEGHRADGSGWAPRMAPTEVIADKTSIIAVAADMPAGIEQRVEVQLVAGPLLRVRAAVTNVATTAYDLDGLTLTVPLPGWAREAMRLGGRWSNEFRPERHRVDTGAIEVENRAGRTSHDHFPAIFVGSPGFGETSGELWGAHLGWSGNSRLRVEVLGDGRRILQAGEVLLPGEIVLGEGEEYSTPWLYLASSNAGLNGISDAFHGHIRARETHPDPPRPVLLNTWEAVYFDHDLDTLTALADRAAAIGVERFVLDDGWFRHRRNDRAGLGDWFVDETVWPDGLHPLVDHVRGLGLEFGLWFEPEMVNPDSDLYRAHPDWALVPDHQEPILARNQLVLDLCNPEVFGYLRERLVALLAEYEIGYVKWDMNRNLVAPTHRGRATVHHQTRAFYRLLDEVRAAHPTVEIESCASGGGRADFEVLARTDRVWTSDCNDALDRQRIQRGFSYLFPPELMGAHIGPPQSHTTGRTHGLAFRAATAFFGHLGIEWNVLQASEAELVDLAHIIELHKRFRPLLHGGRVVRLDHPDPAIVAHAVVAPDQAEAIVSFAQVATSDALAVASLRIPGLRGGASYRVSELQLAGDGGAGRAKRRPAWVGTDTAFTGSQLAVGLQFPVINPESAILLHVVADQSR